MKRLFDTVEFDRLCRLYEEIDPVEAEVWKRWVEENPKILSDVQWLTFLYAEQNKRIQARCEACTPGFTCPLDAREEHWIRDGRPKLFFQEFGIPQGCISLEAWNPFVLLLTCSEHARTTGRRYHGGEDEGFGGWQDRLQRRFGYLLEGFDECLSDTKRVGEPA